MSYPPLMLRANEIGSICKALNVDSHEVMKIFVEDTKLNIAPYYLRPGFAFGGSCLPKDLRAVNYVAKELDVQTPLLGSVLASNDAHIQRVIDTVLERPRRTVALVGLSFKVGSDDLRESPFVRLAEGLIGKGVPLRIYDPDVAIGQVFGRNRAYIDEHLPHVAQLFGDSLSDVVQGADVVIVGKRVAGIDTLYRGRRDTQAVIDLVGIAELGHVLRPWASSGAANLAPWGG